VASKIVESLFRPTIMVAIDEEAGSARGSCRSIDGFHIFDALNACRQHLVRCGGHKAAAGFDMRPENLEAFREAIQEVARTELDEELLQPTVRVDAEIPIEGLSLRLARDLARLEPYGHGNHEPVFVTRGLSIREQRRMQNRASEERDHLKLRLEHPVLKYGLEAVFWRGWCRAEECPARSRLDACYTVELNHYNGFQNLQLNLRDLRTA
jgi:single-stranded-DNA-specific exonuclease